MPDFYDDNDFLAPKIEVVLSCNGEYFPEVDLPEEWVLGIQEDMQGRDLLTFICPECGETHESYRLG